MERCFLLALVVITGAGICPHARGQDADLTDKVSDAIDKGVKYLTKLSEKDTAVQKRPGLWALRAWALLEAGVPAGDATIQKLTAYVRAEVPEMHGVYDVALALILLDKLADPADEPFIESLAVRLLAGQNKYGGWQYDVDKPNVVEIARIKNLLSEVEKLRAQGVQVKFRKRTPQEIVRDVARQLATIHVVPNEFGGDNSNTQFAMIALWVARRHGVPVVPSMTMVERRYQISQLRSGAWAYDFPIDGTFHDDNQYTYPAMTCAGLLGLALGQGVQPRPRDLRGDIRVKAGFTVIAQALAKEPAAKKDNFDYFLFSMERAAVVYNIEKIGAIDWYSWGAHKLVASQANDGSWSGGHPLDGTDTCFALLFLKRANVAHDLTDLLDAPIRKAPKK
jgi:hypothetical protein